MKIKCIEIKNFRSIVDATIEPDNFNFFIGQNNHGKTNFFEALNYFYNGLERGQTLDEVKYNHETSLDLSISVEFVELQNAIDAMKNEKNKESIKKVIGTHDSIIVSKKNDEKLQISIDGKILEKNPTGFDNAFKDFLPRLEYVSTRKYFDDVGKFDKKTPIGIMLSGVLEAIIEKNESYRQLKEKFTELFEGDKSPVSAELKELSRCVEVYLKKQFPDCETIRFEIAPPQFSEYLKNFDTHVNDGVETSVSDKGDGMQRALMLAIIQAYADYRKKDDDIGKSFIFLIDEAELHLHPTAQRKLKNALFDICTQGDQIFVNTHSSVLITDRFDGQKIFKVEKEEKQTSISLVQETIDKQNIVYDLLGGSPTDLLLPANFLIVEGESEGLFVDGIIKKYYPEMPDVKVIGAEGFAAQAGRLAGAIGKIYAPLESIYGEKLIVLLDEPNSTNLGEYTAFRSRYTAIVQSGRLFNIGNQSLEDYYPPHLIQGKNKNHKIKLARHVLNNITQQEFETSMTTIYMALKKCWELSYRNGQSEIGGTGQVAA